MIFVFNTSSYMSLLGCRFVFYDLFLQVRKGCVYCEGTIKDNDILIGLCKAPHTSRAPSAPGNSSSPTSSKFRADATPSSAKRLGWNWRRAPPSGKAVLVDLLGSDSE